MAEEGYAVDLYIYDLSLGFASILAPSIIGREVEGVWHTSIVVYDREYFYGGGGITSCAPGGTQLGPPHQVERLGRTHVPAPVFVEWVRGLAGGAYTGAAYSLLDHNCNHFSEDAAQFLCGAHVPKRVLAQADVLPAATRAALAQLLAAVAPPDAQPLRAAAAPAAPAAHARDDSPDYLTLNDQIEEARAQSARLEQSRSSLADKLARKERRKEKKRKKHCKENGEHAPQEMADGVETMEASAGATLAGPSTEELEFESEERNREEQIKRTRDPPIVYTDIDGMTEFEELIKRLEGSQLSEEDQQSVEELRQYLAGEGSWVLGDEFLGWVGRVLGGERGELRAALLRCLAAAALRDDVSLLLHQDRRHHALLSHAANVEALPLDEQQAIALFMCNLFESVSASEWLLYISEWELRGQPTSNIRVTTKVCVHCMLAEDEVLRERGTALLHNLATKEVKTVRFQAGKQLRDLLPRHAKSKVFDEVCVELCMAALQLLQLAPREAQLWRALRALARLAQHSHDVPQLIAMVGPDPNTYRGTSPRVDEQIDLILKKVKA